MANEVMHEWRAKFLIIFEDDNDEYDCQKPTEIKRQLSSTLLRKRIAFVGVDNANFETGIE